MTVVLAIDPGRTTAMIVRHRDRLLDHRLLDNLDLDRHLEATIETVTVTASDLAARHRPGIVAVEAATAPSPHLGITNPAPIIGTAHIVGALVIALAATIVPAGRHGAKIPAGTPGPAARRMLESLYPPELIGPRETTGTGKGARQHLRAAWDLADAAVLAARTGHLDL